MCKICDRQSKWTEKDFENKYKLVSEDTINYGCLHCDVMLCGSLKPGIIKCSHEGETIYKRR